MAWISVKDRLPNLGSYVLCCAIPDNQIVIAEYAKRNVLNKNWRLENITAFYVDDCCDSTQWLATHWMPLPEVPKK